MSDCPSIDNARRAGLTKLLNQLSGTRYCATCNRFRAIDRERPGRTRLAKSGRRIWRCANCCERTR